MWSKIKNMVIKPEIKRENKVKACTVRLKNEDVVILDNLAEKMNVTRSHVIRRILNSFFDEYNLRVEDEKEKSVSV